MGWYIICWKCEGTGKDPDDKEKDCPICKDSGRIGHVWRESFL